MRTIINYVDKMILSLLLAPTLGMLLILTNSLNIFNISDKSFLVKLIGIISSIITFALSLIIFIIFDFSNIEYQFVQEVYEIKGLNIFLGIDGISIYFVLLTTFITPIVLLSN
jgi:NADH:ubiquinone oxidoreductase subunit 4 (subunit M)